MTEIKDLLVGLNPWWGGNYNVPAFKEREIYAKISKFMKYRQILSLTGIRRVGKTTMMRKLIFDSIQSGTDPKKIIYFSFDESRNVDLRQIISAAESLTGSDVRNGRHLLFFDEIQKLDDWQDKLKSIYDLYDNVKILISGSESLFIRKRSKESLAGRIFEFKIDTLSFSEFLAFKGAKSEPKQLYQKELRMLFSEYIRSFGFPELVGVMDKDVIRRFVEEGIVEKVVYRDIPEIFKVKEIDTLASLQRLLMSDPGQLLDLNDLSKELGTSRQSLSNYLTYLEESFMLKKLYNYSKNARKSARSLKKYYPTIASVDLVFREGSDAQSKVFEWAVVNTIKPSFFWRDPQKHEVDMVLVSGEKSIPIEVKFGKIETRGLEAFMKKFGVKKGYILTPEKAEEMPKGISVIPAYNYLLDKPGQ